jgi:hypothetical protein
MLYMSVMCKNDDDDDDDDDSLDLDFESSVDSTKR